MASSRETEPAAIRVGERRTAILALFLLSGASGLIYQVVWFRLLATVFGATVPAVTTVLAAFMSGLALGSYLLGRWSDRSRKPLRRYAGYELGIAVTALAALVAMEGMRPLAALLGAALGGGAGLAALRFAVAFLVMLIPTTLMGATLPILSRALVRRHAHAGVRLSSLYAANTWGAALGALLAGFLLIRLLGLRGTVLVAVATNAAVAAAAYLLDRYRPVARQRHAVAEGLPAPAAGDTGAGRRLVGSLRMRDEPSPGAESGVEQAARGRPPQGEETPSAEAGSGAGKPARARSPRAQGRRAPSRHVAPAVTAPPARSGRAAEPDAPAVVVTGAHQSELGAAEGSAAEPSARRHRPAALLLTFAAAGVATLAYEVLWSRVLHALLGNSTYAFATTLVVFLAGIALGGWLIRFVIDRARPLRLYAALQTGVAAAAFLSVPLLIRVVDLRSLQGFFAAAATPWAVELAVRFGASVGLLLVPTTLMGATFPLVARLYLSHPSRAGAEVGTVYAAGTAGNIGGALLAGFLLVPLAGITRSLGIVALLNLAVAVAIILVAGRPRRATRLAVSGGFLAVAAAVVAVPVTFQFPADTEAAGDVVLFYREGVTATTKVYEKPLSGQKHMSVDGIYIGGAGGAEKKEQVLAHLPKLLLARYRSELAVGLGSGVVPGESGRHAALERLDIVEIARSVADGAAYFARENHAILDDPRVRLMVTDGLHFLATSTTHYDIIASDAKSRPKSRGNGLFYSREYYALVHDRLSPEGLFIQWLPLHLPRPVYESVLHTFAASFPHASLWVLPDRDTFLVGSRRRVPLDLPQVAARLRDAAAAGPAADPFAGLRRHGVTSATALAALYVADRDALLAATAAAPINSLNHPHIEFYAFADYARSANHMIADNYALLLALRAGAQVPPAAHAVHRAVDRYLQALGKAYALEQDAAAIEELLAEAVGLVPGDALLRSLVLDYYATRVGGRLRAGDLPAARRYLAAARLVGGGDPEVHRLAALLHLHGGDQTGAVTELRAAVTSAPADVALRTALFRLLWQRGAVNEALAHLEAVLAVAPDSAFAHRTLGLYHARRRADAAAALPYLEAAYARTPRDAELIGALAWARYELGDRAGARAVVRAGGRYHRGRPQLSAERDRILQR